MRIDTWHGTTWPKTDAPQARAVQQARCVRFDEWDLAQGQDLGAHAVQDARLRVAGPHRTTL
jgi:hypothetical protein